MRMRGSQKGFTIIELMVTLVILAIMMSLAVPSFTKMIRDNRVQTASTSLMSVFNLARAEAIRRGRGVSICAVDDPNASPPVCGTTWETGWTIFIDADADAVIDAGEEFRIGSSMSGVAVTGGIALVTFNSRGQPTAGVGDYIFNPADCTTGVDKQFTISLGAAGRSNSAEGVCP